MRELISKDFSMARLPRKALPKESVEGQGPFKPVSQCYSYNDKAPPQSTITSAGAAERNALDVRVTQVYDPVNQRVALVDGRSNRTTFTFDAIGRQTRDLSPQS